MVTSTYDMRRPVRPGAHRLWRTRESRAVAGAVEGASRPTYTGGVSTLSDLVLAQGRSSEADVEWLHLLVGDWQLLADLAFADMVLWVPTDTGSYVAVAHARPSSSATLFYRDFVGQEVRPEWRSQIQQAFETTRIVDSAAPDWYEETPTRVRAVPVLRRLGASRPDVTDAPIAVITRHTNLSEARTPSRQELTFNQCSNDLFAMIAAGDFPDLGAPTGPRRGAPRRGPVGAPRSGKSPAAIIANRSLLHWLKVSSWRLGVRASLRFVCRVMTAMGASVTSGRLAPSRRRTGTARTRVGVSSYQSGAAESTMRVVSKACWIWDRHSGRTSWPTKSR